ncbi:MAG: DUF4349 domain-containing protein [Anaerolineae bacterium]|nr:DUF4349 domain-containing protein [Anaerolineae bacterium]
MKTRSTCNPISYLALFFLLFTMLTACGAARAPEQTAAYAPEPAIMPEDGAAAEAPSSAPVEARADYSGRIEPIEQILYAAAQPQESRIIIYTGNISLVVQDTREAMTAITGLAQEQGGYVSASNVYQAGEVPRGSITIRVPAESYLDTLEKLRALAVRVESENSGTEDVSEEFTDLQARKANLEVTEKALQQLLEERQRVGSTSDILEVYRELTGVRGQIEEIEGRLRYLANKAALSTITIELIPDVLSQPVSVAGWEPQGVAKEAVQALVIALQGLVNVTIWLVIFILPLLIIFLIPVVLVIWAIRAWWKRYKARRRSSPPTPPAGAPAGAE